MFQTNKTILSTTLDYKCQNKTNTFHLSYSTSRCPKKSKPFRKVRCQQEKKKQEFVLQSLLSK